MLVSEVSKPSYGSHLWDGVTRFREGRQSWQAQVCYCFPLLYLTYKEAGFPLPFGEKGIYKSGNSRSICSVTIYYCQKRSWDQGQMRTEGICRSRSSSLTFSFFTEKGICISPSDFLFPIAILSLNPNQGIVCQFLLCNQLRMWGYNRSFPIVFSSLSLIHLVLIVFSYISLNCLPLFPPFFCFIDFEAAHGR